MDEISVLPDGGFALVLALMGLYSFTCSQHRD